MDYSITYIGIIVLVVSKIMDIAGVSIGGEEITKFIETGMVLVGGFIAFWGRYRAGQIKWFGGRKVELPANG